MDGVVVPLLPCVQVAAAAAAAAVLAAIVVGVGVLPVPSRERTSMTRCGQVLSTRLAAARTSSMTEGGCLARGGRGIWGKEGGDEGGLPRKPKSGSGKS